MKMNTRITIKLNEFEKIKKFMNVVVNFTSEIDVLRNRYVIDAKSSMGIFTIDLSTPVDVEIHSADEEEIRRFNEAMEEFK